MVIALGVFFLMISVFIWINTDSDDTNDPYFLSNLEEQRLENRKLSAFMFLCGMLLTGLGLISGLF